jgi:hypothetical protein
MMQVYIIRASYYNKSLPEQAHPNIRAELPQSVYATNEERVYAITKAEELKDQLDSLYPTFVRPLTLSHATGSYLVKQEYFYSGFTICNHPICEVFLTGP